MTDKATVAEQHWDKAVGRHREPFAHWESPAPIQRRLNWIVSGDERINSVQWFVNKFGPFKKVADLGCGDGVLIMALSAIARGTAIDAYDFSQASIDRSRERAGAVPNLSLRKFDLNREKLPTAAYDAIFATGTMHHIEKLDFCFTSMFDAMKPDGMLWLNDYFGPSRFQWSDTQMRLANELLSLVPEKWRLSNAVIRFDAKVIEDIDPSEAVAPHVIDDALFAHFEIIRKVPRGGTLLAPIFGSGCLNPDMVESEEGLRLLHDLYETERSLISDGILKSDSFLYIARRRPEREGIVGRSFSRLKSDQTPPPA
jgi:SAM-dependent methyltransferase